MTISNDVVDVQSSEETNETGEGYIYIIENEAFETPVVKIGKAKNLSQRINTLNTGVPVPFTCPKASKVEDMNSTEKFLHQTFHHAKGPWRGEFFEVEAWRVAEVLKLFEIEDATNLAPNPDKEEDIASINAANQRKNAHFNFAMVKIEPGFELKFASDESIIAKVLDNKHIEYEGEKYSISGLAKRLKGTSYRLNGTLYWKYGDETLQERRNRLEVQENNDVS